jgi:hypothetical protein
MNRYAAIVAYQMNNECALSIGKDSVMTVFEDFDHSKVRARLSASVECTNSVDGFLW